MIEIRQKKFTPILLILIAAGYLGNYFSLSMFFGVDFLFGSIPVLLVVRLFGVGWGTLAAILASWHTVVLWNHPYAAIILICEAIFIGFSLHRYSKNMLFLDGIYWLLIGMPLVWIFYAGALQVDTMQTLLIALKQSVNGIFNALVASLILTNLPIQKWIAIPQAKNTISFQQTLLNLFVAFVFFPSLTLMVLNGHRVIKDIETGINTQIISTNQEVVAYLESWYQRRVDTLEELAKVAAESGTDISDRLQQSTALIKRISPAFDNLYVTDAGGTIIAAYPVKNELGRSMLGLNIAKKHGFEKVKKYLKALITDGHIHIHGEHEICLNVPVIVNKKFGGVVNATVDMRDISERMKSHISSQNLQTYLIDNKGRIIANSKSEGGVIDRLKSGEIRQKDNGIYQWLPPKENLPPIVRWKNSFYRQETPVGENLPWKLVVEVAAAPYILNLQNIYINNLAIMLIIAGLAFLSAMLVSRRLVSPLSNLAAETANLPDKIMQGERIYWLNNSVTEIEALVDNFKIMEMALHEKFQEINNAKETLEQRVKERTDKLVKANKKLRNEIWERKRSEKSLREKEEELARIFETIPDGITVVNREGKIVSANAAAEKILRLSRSKITERIYNDPAWRIATVDGKPFPEEELPFVRVMRTAESVYNVEHAIEHPDGTRTILSINAAPIHNAAGIVVSAIAASIDITDRKVAEQALRESEQRYRTVIETVAEEIVLHLADGTIQACNASAERILGLSADEMMGRNSFDPRWCAIREDGSPFPGEEHPAMVTLRIGKPQSNVVMGLAKSDGMVTWISINTRPLFRSEETAPYAIVSSFFDITDRKLAEEALRKSEEMYRTLAKNFPNGAVILFDRDLRYTIADGEGLAAVGLNKELLEGKTIWESFPSETCAIIEPTYRAALGGEASITEVNYSNYTYVMHVLPVRNDRGEIFAGMVMTQDITDLKQAEAEIRKLNADLEQRVIERTAQLEAANQLKHELLVREQIARTQAQASEQRFRFLAEIMPQLVWTARPDGGLDYVNQRTVDYFVVCAAEILEWGWQNMLYPDDLPLAGERWQKSLQTGEPYEIEFRLLRGSDKTYRWHLVRALPLQDRENKIVSWFGTCTDIDDRKQAEEILRQQAEALEQANRMKDEFLAVVSHELRTPLNSVLGWAQLLRARKFDEPTTDRALETIERNAKLQAQLIDDILDISRIIRGKLRLSMRPVDLVSVIAAAIDSVVPTAAAKKIQLESKLDAVGLVLVDADRLQQVVWNLVCNAIKFTPSGGRVEVRLQQLQISNLKLQIEDENFAFNLQSEISNLKLNQCEISYAQITVKDTGKGISPDFLPYVFDRFRQADSSITRTYGGLGLGLAIVRHLVELHGGTVCAASDGEGKGATFIVRLPLWQESRREEI
ncbi:PAS domain S-box protein [Aerosakkonema funiforme]|uniref:histidine kinase n=3 Tax=Oscillatoriophycideae TaxID=1301283 RepID=A0A926VF97_9CYAN|nr:PAS domain S-box protein [Aerosakkonema funiforme]MBD2182208.1 PAS domain S-box protein [Aerosakkonema funiforme FACHB-1375]